MLSKELQQSLLNQAVAKIRAQGRPSGFVQCGRCKSTAAGCICPDTSFQHYVCRYRHEGACCVVGSLIPDEHYSEDMEGESAEEAGVVMVLQLSGFPVESDDDVEFFMELQHAHDDAAEDDEEDGRSFLDRFNEGISDLCVKRGLHYPEVQS